MAWTQGVLVFDNITLKQATRVLERKFNVTISFNGSTMSNCLIKGRFEERSLHSILKIICSSLSAEYKVGSGRKIFITGPGCKLINE